MDLLSQNPKELVVDIPGKIQIQLCKLRSILKQNSCVKLINNKISDIYN